MPRWTEQQLRDVVASADSYSDVLRAFGLRTAGGNAGTVRKWIEKWGIPIDHFTHGADRPRAVPNRRPLREHLVEGATIRRDKLKQRLYSEDAKQRACELCGQGEQWNGARMSLILDHVNGVFDDNRLENLRIVCPNCNATLPTHCGKNRPPAHPPRPCPQCDQSFRPNRASQRFCSRVCWQRARSQPRPDQRRVERPPYEQLMEEIATSSWSAVGRRYGVSCNAVRKWVTTYQWQRAEAAAALAGGAAGAGEEARRDAA